jgi:hypothetical protein
LHFTIIVHRIHIIEREFDAPAQSQPPLKSSAIGVGEVFFFFFLSENMALDRRHDYNPFAGNGSFSDNSFMNH